MTTPMNKRQRNDDDDVDDDSLRIPKKKRRSTRYLEKNSRLSVFKGVHDRTWSRGKNTALRTLHAFEQQMQQLYNSLLNRFIQGTALDLAVNIPLIIKEQYQFNAVINDTDKKELHDHLQALLTTLNKINTSLLSARICHFSFVAEGAEMNQPQSSTWQRSQVPVILKQLEKARPIKRHENIKTLIQKITYQFRLLENKSEDEQNDQMTGDPDLTICGAVYQTPPPSPGRA